MIRSFGVLKIELQVKQASKKILVLFFVILIIIPIFFIYVNEDVAKELYKIIFGENKINSLDSFLLIFLYLKYALITIFSYVGGVILVFILSNAFSQRINFYIMEDNSEFSIRCKNEMSNWLTSPTQVNALLTLVGKNKEKTMETILESFKFEISFPFKEHIEIIIPLKTSLDKVIQNKNYDTLMFRLRLNHKHRYTNRDLCEEYYSNEIILLKNELKL